MHLLYGSNPQHPDFGADPRHADLRGRQEPVGLQGRHVRVRRRGRVLRPPENQDRHSQDLRAHRLARTHQTNPLEQRRRRQLGHQGRRKQDQRKKASKLKLTTYTLFEQKIRIV